MQPTMHRSDTEKMVRVDHAGEFGACRIYAGQMAVAGTRSSLSGEIAHMARQEEKHLAAFEKLMHERRVRPTLFMPVWHVAGFALGAASAIVGEKMMMAVTAAVETEIDQHYQAQRETLARHGEDPELEGMIAEYQREEQEHRDSAIQHGAEQAPGYPLVSALIRAGCRAAIHLSTRF